MRLQDSARTVDYYPVGTGKSFVRCVTWHPGEETEMKSFQTIVKSEALYDINNRLANDYQVIGFNLEAYAGKDYTPVMC